MKHFVLLLLSLLSTMVVSAQTTLVATLTHAGEVKSFYSANALKDAYAAAEDGDIITLSAGTFAATDFKTKKVTVRGAGMMPGSNQTVVTGNTSFAIEQTANNGTIPFVVEGISFISNFVINSQLIDASFLKCRFKCFQSFSKLTARFVHCIVEDGSFGSEATTEFVSSTVLSPSFSANGNSIFNNCTICFESFTTLYGKSYKNCLFVTETAGHYALYSGTNVSNCYYVGESTIFFQCMPYAPNTSFPKGTPVFKEGTTTYELTDENARTWLGDDGTQVGIHGGSLPFDPATNNPKITKFNVAPKTTADGKLSVDIEIQAL